MNRRWKFVTGVSCGPRTKVGPGSQIPLARLDVRPYELPSLPSTPLHERDSLIGFPASGMAGYSYRRGRE